MGLQDREWFREAVKEREQAQRAPRPQQTSNIRPPSSSAPALSSGAWLLLILFVVVVGLIALGFA